MATYIKNKKTNLCAFHCRLIRASQDFKHIYVYVPIVFTLSDDREGGGVVALLIPTLSVDLQRETSFDPKYIELTLQYCIFMCTQGRRRRR